MMAEIKKWGLISWLGIAAACTLLVQILFSFSPQLAEQIYGNIYPILRNILDHLHLPWPGIFIVLTLVAAVLIIQIFIFGKRRVPLKTRLIRSGKFLLGLAFILVIWFYLFWGFNYGRPDILERMGIQRSLPDTSWLFSETDQVIQLVNEIRDQPELHYLNELEFDHILSTDFDLTLINSELELVLPNFGYDLQITPTVCFLEPDGFLLHWSTTGIYWPFTGESNIDKGVHLIKKPVTITHELAHAHGLTSEGDCNFVAYLACRDSDNKLHQYSAQLSYLGYLLRDVLKTVGKEGLTTFYDKMSEEVKLDRKNIYAHHDLYEDYFPNIRNKVYDSFLKSQGVKGGISNYNYFVNLKYTWDRYSDTEIEK